jgi:hypothetical protein
MSELYTTKLIKKVFECSKISVFHLARTDDGNQSELPRLCSVLTEESWIFPKLRNYIKSESITKINKPPKRPNIIKNDKTHRPDISGW